MAVTCVWCGEELCFIVGKGWVHKFNMKLYKQRPDGTDDHCALPRVDKPLVVHREEAQGAVFLNVRTTFPVEAVVTIGVRKFHMKGQAKFNIIRNAWKFADELQLGVFCHKNDQITEELRNPSEWNRVEIVGLPLQVGIQMFDEIRKLVKRG